MTEIEIKVAVVPGTKCDFCNSPKIAWEYPARSYQLESLGVPEANVKSFDAWSACETCHGLIQCGNWRGLAERSIESLDFPDMPIEIVMALHQEFRANWIGPARKVEEGKK